VKPTLWQKFANLITAGWAYADIVNPKPDRDPAAIDGILYSSDGRRAIITVEMEEHSKQPSAQVNQERKSYEQRLQEEVNNFSRIPDDSIRREFPKHELSDVIDMLNKRAFREATYMEDTVLGALISKSTVFIRDKLSKEYPKPQDIREAMAAAVLLESAKEEYLSGKGDTMCNQLMKNQDGMVKSLASTDAFRAFTEDASVDMLKHFIMSDGARNLYRAMKNIATKQQEQGKEANALEQNIQQQKEKPIAGLS
jgi:hypothetical protein